MLDLIKVSAFKSLVDFELKLTKFNCIIGLNGSGKSTVLQLISYISSIFEGNTQQWLHSRGWENNEVASHFFTSRETIDFKLVFTFDGKQYKWLGTYNWNKGICTKERFCEDYIAAPIIFRVHQGVFTGKRGVRTELNFKYSGSVLSGLNDDMIPHEALRLRDYIANIDSHDLLSPKVMRSGQYSQRGKLGSAGEYLINDIHQLKDTSELEILRLNLSKFFPQVQTIETKPQSNGTLALMITERFYNKDASYTDVITDARHINDGMLRLLNILANQRRTFRFQLFDEIENGMNPEITEKLMDSFVNAPQQTLITTHSPIVLNFLDEDVAKQSVILVYKKASGHTGAKHLFEVPSALRKLDILSPGEAMVDLHLSDVAKEIENDTVES
jgi:predicted ATPase